MVKMSKIGIVFMMVFLLTGIAYGFGISSDYWDGKPLVLAPGESREITLGLQNMVGNDDITVDAVISEGKEIAVLIDNPARYTIPSKQEGVNVRLRVSIPENTALNTKYNVAVNLNQIGLGDKQGGEMVQLSTGVGTKIPVIVKSISGREQLIEEEKPLAEEVQETGWSTSSIVVTVAIVVLLILIGYAVLKKSKKSKK